MVVNALSGNPVKSLFLSAERPYSDMGDLVQIARAEGSKILRCDKVKVLEIIACRNLAGYVAVVQASGGTRQTNG
jgi:hypothetical protein